MVADSCDSKAFGSSPALAKLDSSPAAAIAVAQAGLAALATVDAARITIVLAPAIQSTDRTMPIHDIARPLPPTFPARTSPRIPKMTPSTPVGRMPRTSAATAKPLPWFWLVGGG